MKITQIPSVPKKLLEMTGEALALARKERGWRQMDLAERLGMSRQTIARMEQGDPRVAAGTYFTAAWMLNVPIFPGMDVRDAESKEILEALIHFLKRKLPHRVAQKPEKPIDDRF